MQNYEQLGLFYLGSRYDLQQKKRSDELVLYDSKDLLTHAVCVGMTGSGKTGLCIGLLEEAAIDGIPSIVIDPKGDLSNLLLTFPNLQSQDFEPWINPDDARQKGMSPQQFAAQQAEFWKNGLASWAEDGERIRRFRDSAEFRIYTPGGNAGIPVSILKSFAAPASAILDDPELLRERINTTVSSLLGLVGIQADPLQSREHILISTLLNTAWKQGRDLDLAAIIQQIQNPGVPRIGVMDIESFFPSKDRFALSMQLNNLLAAPGFEAWLEGDALDPGAFLNAPNGKPRVSIFSISHLNDSERMFFVSLLLTQILGWIRTQSGTTSLRAVLYMDEIFGYFPPVANPPSKAPLLTLLKQARAFGLGIVLATQNPVDLDYKGLSNAGTWFIGRLQTEQDKARVLDGLQSAVANPAMNRQQIENILGNLTSRVFLMNNAHEDEPVVFQTRWTLSYLRGPLTREQIRSLMNQSRPAQAEGQGSKGAGEQGSRGAEEQAGGGVGVQGSKTPPVVPPGIPQYFLVPQSSGPITYQPMLVGRGKIYYADAKIGVAAEQDIFALLPFTDSPSGMDWQNAKIVQMKDTDLEKFPHADASFADLPSIASKAKSYDVWTKSFSAWLTRTQTLQLFKSPSSGQVSKPGENERDFRLRLAQGGREQRDQSVERIRQKYASRITALQDRIARAQQSIQREQQQATAAKVQTGISVLTTIAGAFFGRKTFSASNLGHATTAARGVGRSMKESEDVSRVQDSVQSLQQQLADAQQQLQAEIDDVSARVDPTTEPLQTVEVTPKKGNITVPLMALVWTSAP